MVMKTNYALVIGPKGEKILVKKYTDQMSVTCSYGSMYDTHMNDIFTQKCNDLTLFNDNHTFNFWIEKNNNNFDIFWGTK